MDPTVEQILRQHYVDGVFHTHVSMVQPKGKFQFNRQGLEDFWTAYCKLLQERDDPIVGVAEKPQQYLPVLADIDIKVKEENNVELGDNLYNETHISQVIEVYQSVLRNIVDGCTDEQLLCVLLEKPMYRLSKGETSYVKNGFHLHFPNLFLSKAEQEIHLIPRVKTALQEMEVFSDLGLEDSGSVVDNACCKVPWLVYGSRKSEDMDPYRVTKVFNSDGEEVELEEAFKHYQLFDKQERLIKVSGRVKELLPRILSILPYGRQVSDVKHGLVSPLKEKLREKNNTKSRAKLSVVEALKVSAKLLPMLAQFRAEDRNEWMTVGWALYNISGGSAEGLDQWLEFSSRAADKYDEGICIYEWERMTAKDITLGTLRYYASIDNPEAYNRFRIEQSEQHVADALCGSHNDIAKALYDLYGNEFVCASISSRVWYQFTGHRWEEVEEGVTLRARISGDIVERFVEMGKELWIQSSQTQDKGEAAMYTTRMKAVQKLVQNLKSAPYKNNVMREAAEVFYDPRFRQKLDTNPYLFPFRNGVYDLKLNLFRAGRPEDFISKASPIDYREFDYCDDGVQDVISFFEKVFPDTSLRKYFLDTLSDVFEGGNPRKEVHMWIGEGDNGKTVTQTLVEKMLGELAIKFNTTLITGKKISSGAANPELARAGNGVRWAAMEEPDGDEQINIGTLKSLSGNDSYWARDLFEKGKSTREITPMFKFTFIANKLLRMRHCDKAVANRVRVIPYETTFVRPGEPCPETYEEQLQQKRFPMDKDFAKKIPHMIQPLAWYLLQHRQKITCRSEPEKVRQASAAYMRENDLYRQFVEECTIEDSNSVLSIIEIYSNFKEWYKEGFPGNTIPIKNEVQDYFEKLWGTPARGARWTGYRIRTLQDSLETGDAIILEDTDLVDYSEVGKAPL